MPAATSPAVEQQSSTAVRHAPRRAGDLLARLRALSYFQRLLATQGAYFATTGIWSLVSLRSFERVTGPKTDGWLVKTVGVLVTAIGGTLGLVAQRRQPSPETALLAVGSACGLAGVDITYVAKRRIAPIYLLDALVALALVALWLSRSPHLFAQWKKGRHVGAQHAASAAHSPGGDEGGRCTARLEYRP